MKKFSLLLLLLPVIAFAQDDAADHSSVFINLQLHRDFNREIFTSTIEIFQMDKRGTTFLFADFDYGGAGQQLSYFEISRNILLKTLHWGALNLSVQYNDGVQAIDGVLGMKTIPRTILGGAAVSGLDLGPFTTEFQALLRQEFASDLGWQLTGVWYCPLGNTPLEFLGYVDINSNEYSGGRTSIQTEPQLQVHVVQNTFVGTEIEISRNFSGAWTPDDGFEYGKWYVHPTIYLRYDF